MKICVLGLGYIGLPTALLFAQRHKVIGVDVNKKIVEVLNSGEIPFDEPGLPELFNKVKDNFEAKTDVEYADVFLIAVPTPLNKSLKIADLKYIRLAAEMVYHYLTENNLVILESTVPPGTSERLVLPILKKSGAENFYYTHCPERAIPGDTIHEMINNDRIIGGIDENSSEQTKTLYQSFVKGNLYLSNVKTAEFVKLMENTYRDINIALANEFAQMANENKINIWQAIEMANKHPRVNILKPGPGVGGHCIAIDPWFLKVHSSTSKMISLAREINNSMPNYVLQIVEDLLEGILNPTITVLGVAYKGDVDDTRATPALKFIKLAENEGYQVKVHDPYVKDFEYEILSLDDAVRDSDCIVLITDHSVFREIDPQDVSKLMKQKKVVDTRNLLDIENWKKAGFQIRTIGT